MQLATVSLAVRDLDRSVTFYREAIGLKLLTDGDQKAELERRLRFISARGWGS